MTVEEIKAEINRIRYEQKRGPEAYQAKYSAQMDDLLDQLVAAQAEPVNA